MSILLCYFCPKTNSYLIHLKENHAFHNLLGDDNHECTVWLPQALALASWGGAWRELAGVCGVPLNAKPCGIHVLRDATHLPLHQALLCKHTTQQSICSIFQQHEHTSFGHLVSIRLHI